MNGEVMNFYEFTEKLVDALKKHFKGFDIKTKKSLKNNEELTAIIVSNPGTSTAPTVYAEKCYDAYIHEVDFETYIRRQIDVIENELQTSFSEEEIDEMASLKSVYPLVLGVTGNEELLKNEPHRLIADDSLAVVYRNKLEQGSMHITTQVAEHAGLSEEDLFGRAISGSTFVRKSLYGALCDMMGEDQLSQMGVVVDDRDQPVYVLSNTEMVHGAGVLASEPFLKTTQEKIGDFYILPSSIHEVLVMPKDKAPTDVAGLYDMVVDVNRTQVEPCDFLADAVFEYTESGGLHKIAG